MHQNVFKANKIVEVRLHYFLGASPAAVSHRTGIFYVNPYVWPTLTDDQKYQTIYHEIGHLALGTDNEILADAYSHKEYTKNKKRSLKSTVFFLQKILHPEHPRVIKQLERAKKTDQKRKRK